MPCPPSTITPSDLNSAIKIPTSGISSQTNITDDLIFQIRRIRENQSLFVNPSPIIHMIVEFASTSSEPIELIHNIKEAILNTLNNPSVSSRKWGSTPSWVPQNLNNRCRITNSVAESALTSTLTKLVDGENITMTQGATSDPTLRGGKLSVGPAYYTTMPVILSPIPLLSKQNSSVGIINQPSVNNKILIAGLTSALYQSLDIISENRPHNLISNDIFF